MCCITLAYHVCSVYGQGYAWSPSALIASVGDTVVWLWNAPAFVSGLGYRVFSVSSPSSTDYDGIAFSSGDTRTAKGTNNNNNYYYPCLHCSF